MIMSMAIILQILLGYVVICMKCTLKLKSQTDLRQSPYMAILFRKIHNSYLFSFINFFIGILDFIVLIRIILFYFN